MGRDRPKNVYSWETYKWCNGTDDSLTKYCSNSIYGTVDNLTELQPEYDAACVHWGSAWRTPSEKQITELQKCCTYTKVLVNGVIARLANGPNGNSILLPAEGHYWSRTVGNTPYYACGLRFDSGDWNCYFFRGPRDEGHYIRPVRVSQN